TLLNCVKYRYTKDRIYTFIGPLVLSLNPFKWTIPECQESFMPNYFNNVENAPPHAWSIAEMAYNCMINGGGNQSILVSGESGAGKTEAVKTVIKYLAKKSVQHLKDPEVIKCANEINQKIVDSSPILEAFG